MEESKVKLGFKTPKNKIIEYNNVEIEITPFMSIAEQIALISKYAETYFTKIEDGFIKGSGYNYLEAEFNLKGHILQSNTNIDISDLDRDIYVDSAFWEIITKNILNYEAFLNTLNVVIDQLKDQKKTEKSIEKVFSDLVEKVYLIMDKISTISPEDIQKLQDTGKQLVEKLEQSSLLPVSTKKPLVKKGAKTQ